MSDPWSALAANHFGIKDRRILSLFDDENRFKEYSAQSDGLLLDYSKTNLDAAAFDLLFDLARQTGVENHRDAMFRGDKINTTEGRPALHTALRVQSDTPIIVDGADILPEIRATRARMERFAKGIRSGQIAASDGAPFTDVINIGIGGSDLGPMMATRALAPYHDGPRCHFVSNIDGAHLFDILKPLDPKRTLVIIASKTFTTIETMTNAASAIRWLADTLGKAAPDHLAAVSSATEKAAALGIDPERVFGFGDYVGGRLSLWGPVGLPIMLAVGPKDFTELLKGAASMDQHFCTAPLPQNLPILLALVGIWHRSICGYPTRAVLPYDQRLSHLPAYLQQLDMESNGKSVGKDGASLARSSGPVVWGAPGTNGQHAFYQLLHQGTEVIPAEFLIAANGHELDLAGHHNLLKANCLAQSEALMVGRNIDDALSRASELGYENAELHRQAAHRVFSGNRPSMTLAYDRLTPFTLGQIISLYEHRVFTEATIWGLNPFDQWGVELGKELAVTLLPMVERGHANSKDASTQGLLKRLSESG